MTSRRWAPLVAAGPNVRQLSARRLATRTRLLDAARRVFVDRGVFAATVEEICDAAGFTRGAFYSNFSDKDSLIEAVLLRESDAILEILTELAEHAGAGSDSPASGICAGSGGDDLGEVLAQFFAAQPLGREHYLIHTELRLAAMRDPGAHVFFNEISARQWSRMADAVLVTLRRAGLEPTVPTEDLVEILYGILERSTVRALVEDVTDVDLLARRLLPTVLAALTRPVADRPLPGSWIVPPDQ